MFPHPPPSFLSMLAFCSVHACSHWMFSILAGFNWELHGVSVWGVIILPMHSSQPVVRAGVGLIMIMFKRGSICSSNKLIHYWCEGGLKVDRGSRRVGVTVKHVLWDDTAQPWQPEWCDAYTRLFDRVCQFDGLLAWSFLSVSNFETEVKISHGFLKQPWVLCCIILGTELSGLNLSCFFT